LASACESDAAAEKLSSACEAFLKGSEKAAQQWELEKRFRVFEAGF
jgi:adenosine deaminase